MESLNIFGMIAFVFAILLWGRVQRLEQLLRENGIRPAGTRDLSRRLAKLAGQTVTLSLYSDGWDVSGRGEEKGAGASHPPGQREGHKKSLKDPPAWAEEKRRDRHE